MLFGNKKKEAKVQAESIVSLVGGIERLARMKGQLEANATPIGLAPTGLPSSDSANLACMILAVAKIANISPKVLAKEMWAELESTDYVTSLAKETAYLKVDREFEEK